jgi:hypothetical protein
VKEIGFCLDMLIVYNITCHQMSRQERTTYGVSCCYAAISLKKSLAKSLGLNLTRAYARMGVGDRQRGSEGTEQGLTAAADTGECVWQNKM